MFALLRETDREELRDILPVLSLLEWDLNDILKQLHFNAAFSAKFNALQKVTQTLMLTCEDDGSQRSRNIRRYCEDYTWHHYITGVVDYFTKDDIARLAAEGGGPWLATTAGDLAERSVRYQVLRTLKSSLDGLLERAGLNSDGSKLSDIALAARDQEGAARPRAAAALVMGEAVSPPRSPRWEDFPDDEWTS